LFFCLVSNSIIEMLLTLLLLCETDFKPFSIHSSTLNSLLLN